MLIRRRLSSVCTILPLFITTIGLPHTSFLNSGLFIITAERSISLITSTVIGTSPLNSGFDVFSSAIDAMSDKSIVTTSSLVCRSLICRLPINRTEASITRYKSAVLIIAINIFITMFILCGLYLFIHLSQYTFFIPIFTACVMIKVWILLPYIFRLQSVIILYGKEIFL